MNATWIPVLTAFIAAVIGPGDHVKFGLPWASPKRRVRRSSIDRFYIRGFRRANGSGVQRRGRFRVPKPMLMIAPHNEARKRRA